MTSPARTPALSAAELGSTRTTVRPAGFSATAAPKTACRGRVRAAAIKIGANMASPVPRVDVSAYAARWGGASGVSLACLEECIYEDSSIGYSPVDHARVCVLPGGKVGGLRHDVDRRGF